MLQETGRNKFSFFVFDDDQPTAFLTDGRWLMCKRLDMLRSVIIYICQPQR